MIARRLEPDELTQLTPDLRPWAESVWGLQGRVMVVEDAGMIVGTWGLYPLWHLDGLWIAPAHRGRATVGRRLMHRMKAWLDDQQVTRVATTAVSADVEQMIQQCAGVPLPGTHYVFPVARLGG